MVLFALQGLFQGSPGDSLQGVPNNALSQHVLGVGQEVSNQLKKSVARIEAGFRLIS